MSFIRPEAQAFLWRWRELLGALALLLLALVLLGGIREILGSGSLFGFSLFGAAFEPWVIMILPPGGFLTLGVLLIIFAQVQKSRSRRQALRAEKGLEAA